MTPQIVPKDCDLGAGVVMNQVTRKLPNSCLPRAEQLLREPRFGPGSANSGRRWPHFGRFGATSGQGRPTLTSSSQVLADSGPWARNVDPNCPAIGLHRSILIDPDSGQLWPTHGPHRPDIAEFGPHLASRSNFSEVATFHRWATFGQRGSSPGSPRGAPGEQSAAQHWASCPLLANPILNLTSSDQHRPTLATCSALCVRIRPSRARRGKHLAKLGEGWSNSVRCWPQLAITRPTSTRLRGNWAGLEPAEQHLGHFWTRRRRLGQVSWARIEQLFEPSGVLVLSLSSSASPVPPPAQDWGDDWGPLHRPRAFGRTGLEFRPHLLPPISASELASDLAIAESSTGAQVGFGEANHGPTQSS